MKCLHLWLPCQCLWDRTKLPASSLGWWSQLLHPNIWTSTAWTGVPIFIREWLQLIQQDLSLPSSQKQRLVTEKDISDILIWQQGSSPLPWVNGKCSREQNTLGWWNAHLPCHVKITGKGKAWPAAISAKIILHAKKQLNTIVVQLDKNQTEVGERQSNPAGTATGKTHRVQIDSSQAEMKFNWLCRTTTDAQKTIHRINLCVCMYRCTFVHRELFITQSSLFCPVKTKVLTKNKVWGWNHLY